MDQTEVTWEQYCDILRGKRLPVALVNLDAFDDNIETIAGFVRNRGKTIRVASKSLRCLYLLRRICEKAPDVMRGVMAFTCEEAEFLAAQGFDDLLVAYPSVQPSDMKCLVRLAKAGKTASLIVDCREHLDALSKAARESMVDLAACIELDVSLRPAAGRLHLGVRRSPVRTPEAVLDLVRYARQAGGVNIVGVMAYEAQIAGIPDANPFSTTMNPVRKLVKAASRPWVASLRARVSKALRDAGVELRFFNGGGTGSLGWTPFDEAVTEVTVGSGFLCSHLFSYFQGLHLKPAGFFALQVVRSSDPHYVTCHGGGYVASGEASADKLPQPFLPHGLSLLPLEGAGEVQTPLHAGPSTPRIAIGAPVLFRHAKAGELAERFDEYLLIEHGRLVGAEPTYRGLGKCFL